MDITPLTRQDAEGFFQLVDDPGDADAALVFVESPLCDCYTQEDLDKGGNGYLPITLQYRPYKAEAARPHSIAKGDFRENDCDRTYLNKENTPYNASDLENILSAREAMGSKPVIVVLHMHNPCVVSEFEGCTDGLIAHFGVENKVLMQILSGQSAPGGRLPLTMPASMAAVEQHCEDLFDDIPGHVDSCGNCYSFGFGLGY